MKQKLFAMVFIAIILVLSFLSYKQYRKINQPTLSSEKLNDKNMKSLNNIKIKNTGNIITPTQNQNLGTRYSNQQIIEIQNFISEMKANYTKLNYDVEFKNNILDLYHKNKDTALILKKIIVDHEFALKLANDDQSYARIFAIQGLKEIAISGDKEPLISTIQDFSRLLQIKDSSSKGELADLDDLLRSYISINDIDNFTQNLGEYLATAGFNKSITNKDIYDTYDQAFYFSISSKIGRDKAKEMLNKYFGS